PLRPGPFGIVVVGALHRLADFVQFAIGVVRGAQRVVEHDDALGTGLRLYQGFHLRVIDALDLVRIEEVAHRGFLTPEAEAVALETEAAGVRPAVAEGDAVRVRRAAALDLGRAGSAAVGPRRLAGILEVIDRRLDGVGGGVEFGNCGHGRLLWQWARAGRRFKPVQAPPQ